ncbi:MAG: hypothetical protein KTR33_01800 [Gammaproteobacteria bacterium]|nr:hypothetical protein [Gammaproteobacteria bacterium]
MKKRWYAALAIILFAALVLVSDPAYFAGRSETFAALEPSISTDEERGIAYFAFGDWGSLTSDALRVSASPWKLSLTALALQQFDGDLAQLHNFDAADTFRQFGFHSPETLGNWPAALPRPQWQAPLGQNIGLTHGKVWPTAVTIGNIGCAGCHSSVMYLADGSPDTTRVWLGMPNGSINLEAYTTTLFTAMRDFGDPGKMMAGLDILYPETTWRERLTLRFFVLPEFRKVVAEREAEIGRLLPFRASLAGATNGLDSLKRRLGLIPPGTVLSESIFNSVPDLGGRLWRTKLLNSGSYAIPGINHARTLERTDINAAHRRGLAGIIAYFTVPSMGVSLEVAESHIDEGVAITAWMQNYTPQPYPGDLDTTLLPDGRKLYKNGCASCHGSYDDNLETPALISFPNWEGDIGTDKKRAQLLSQQVADAVNGDLFGQYISARTVSGYTAPPLTGIWASAPYFHNGSVPTLWHLMRPETRPTRFQVGGHHLDLDYVGLAGRDDGQGGWFPEQQPWSIPAEIDTSSFGLSNTGHEESFNKLSEQDKDALLEYLKLL